MHEPRGGCEQGGIVMDGLHIHNDRPRPWLTTYVDPSTRLESIAGTVRVTTIGTTRKAHPAALETTTSSNESPRRPYSRASTGGAEGATGGWRARS